MQPSCLTFPPLLGALLCAWALPAHGQDLINLSLDQLLSVEIVTASKFAQNVSEAPSSVTVVTADDIRMYGFRTLADIMRSMRGVYVAYDRNYSYIGTRGSGRPGDYNTRVLLLIDGQRLNDSTYGQAPVGTEFPIDMELIERVEYVPGPGSAIYGSNAFFGVINIITKKARALAGITVGAEVASYRTHKASFIAAKRFEHGGEGLVSVSDSDSGGIDRYFPEYDDPASNHGVAAGLDSDRSKRLFAKYSLGELTLTGFIGKRVKGIPTASFGQQFNDPRSHTTDRYYSATAAVQHALSRTLDLSADVNFTRYLYSADYAYTAGASGLNRDQAGSDAMTADLRLLSRFIPNHKLIYGLEAYDGTSRQHNFDLAPYASLLDAEHRKRGFAVYVQDEIRLGDQLILNAGVRHDQDANGGNSNSPRLGLIYKLTPDVTTKYLYGTAFRSASAYENYYYLSDTAYSRSALDLKPERIRTYEFVAEYFPRQDFRSSMSVFNYRLGNLISLASNSADQQLYFQNLDSVSAKGVELEMETLGSDGSRLKSSVSFQFARDRGTGDRLTNSPTQQVNLSYSRPLWTASARAGLTAEYSSKRSTVMGGVIGGFTLVNLTLSGIQITPNLDLSASIYNLLDKDFADPPSEEHFDNSSPARVLQSIHQDRRVLRANLAYRF